MTKRSYGSLSFEAKNLDKVLFPGSGITKGDLLAYYERVAEFLLPHLEDRPLVLQRFPDGIGEEGFFQKETPGHFPDWIERVRVKKEGGSQDLVVCNNTATLAYLADQACVTLHPWLSRKDALDTPDLLVFDLDPPGAAFEPVREGALRLRDLLEDLDLKVYLKTTGSRGLHVEVPLDRSAGFDDVRAFARDAAALLARRHPGRFTTEQRKDKRKGRLYLDTGLNAYAQTAVAPYSVRALEGAPVAAPLRFDELSDRGLDARSYTMQNLFRRLAQTEDPFRGMRRHARSLASARKALDALIEEEGPDGGH